MNTIETIEELKRKNAELEKEINFLKKQQIDIKQAKELYLKIFEEFPALIWRSGLDKNCDYFNKTWLEFTGRTLDEEIGNGWAENVHPDDFDFCVKTYVEAFDRREAFLMEYRLKNKFGEYRWIRDFGRPFYDLDNSFSGYIGSCYDVTEEKNNELKLIELNATKDRFFSILAHDLRNPFHSICCYAEVLHNNIRKYDYEKMERLTKELMSSSKNTYALLENLLIWARSQSKNILFKPESFKLIDIIPELMSQIEPLAHEKTILVKTDLSHKVMIYADKNMLETILRNILTNAIKFSYCEHEIIFHAYEDEKDTIICIEDFGTGMPNEIANSLFKIDTNPTTQGTMKEKGSGLGLILCKEFTDKHQGKIWAESTPEKGSKFFISLPLQHFKNRN